MTVLEEARTLREQGAQLRATISPHEGAYAPDLVITQADRCDAAAASLEAVGAVLAAQEYSLTLRSSAPPS
ncbi:hypothetical protein [Streptomyces boninensis]|uniref:hypothetical protein n=1 Tax=Streptomyces boninensis TaxID=2039455 RepID=UPI003B20E2D3